VCARARANALTVSSNCHKGVFTILGQLFVLISTSGKLQFPNSSIYNKISYIYNFSFKLCDDGV